MPARRTRLVFSVLAVVAMASAPPPTGAVDPLATMRVERLASPEPAPELATPSLDGKVVRLQDFRGKAVLLGFFTTT